MFKPGDLLWIPQGTMMVTNDPKAPLAFLSTKKPTVGLYMNPTEEEDFSYVMVEGQKWAIRNKEIRHLRRDNVSEVN